MNKILITGGCGFIGSHVVEFFFSKYKNSKIIVYDKITYAGNARYLNKIVKSNRLKIIKKDINDFNSLLKYTKKVDLLIHMAAESHVDNSFESAKKFIDTNVQGTRSVLDACRVNKIKKIIHVSTDEIYGEIYKGSFSENSNFNPSNPYSSSKAAAEMIIKGYQHSFKLNITIVRANNIFGERQHPEKLIGACCCAILKKEFINLHGNGLQKRTFLYVKDFAEALYRITKLKNKNEIFNIGTNFEYKNIDVVKLIVKKFNKEFKNVVKFVQDRPFNDHRYSINIDKIKKLNWHPKHRLEDKMHEIINWYKVNFKLFKYPKK